jgi:CheY-like chemotaxis protein
VSCGVLVVEDDPDLRLMMAHLLAAEGFETMVAANGRQALEALEHGPTPQVILLDLMMPVMDGFAFRQAQQLLPRFAHIPVIVLSAVAERASSIHAVATLKKPLDVDALIAALRAHC